MIKDTKIMFIKKIESELLSTLFNYIVPFIDKKIKTIKKEEEQKTSTLENIVNNTKPKIDFKDVKELESLLLKNFNSKAVEVFSNVTHKEKNSITEQLSFFYLRRQKDNNEKTNNYSISIKYEESGSEDKLKISIKKEEQELYSAQITNKKDLNDKSATYSIKILYENNYAEERLSIAYKRQLKNYMQQHIESKEDMANRVPLKWLNILPETLMGGVLGFTYLGENFMARRADLTGKTARMVDIHESIHTPDEYETRVLTSWIMEKVRNKYIK